MDYTDFTRFVNESMGEISAITKGKKAICTLSGGVDSSVVTVLAHMAMNSNSKVYYFDDGFRKKEEYEFVKNAFRNSGRWCNISINCYDINKEMWNFLGGVSDNSLKRPLFKKGYSDSFLKLLNETGAECFFQGTNQADIKMYEKGQNQNNVNIFYPGIKIIEPLTSLYKHEIRKLAKYLDLPDEIVKRQPFPGPGFVIRCLGEITKEKIDILREAQEIAEEELADLNLFQIVVTISGDKVCSMIDRAEPNKYILYVKAIKSKDAMKAKAIIPKEKIKERLEERLMDSDNRIGRVMWDSISKPPATIEYI